MVVPGRALTAAPGTTLFDEATCGWRLEIWQHVYTHRRGVATRVSPLQLPVPGSTSGTNAVRREAASRAVWGSTPATEGRMGKREGTRARAGPGTKRDPSQHEHVGGHRSPHCCICVCSVRCAVFCGCLRRCTGSAPASCVRLKPRDLLSQVFSFYLLRKPFSVEYRLDLPYFLPFFCLLSTMSTRSAEIAEEIRQLVADSAAADEKAASRHALAEQSIREAETFESAASELTARGVREG